MASRSPEEVEAAIYRKLAAMFERFDEHHAAYLDTTALQQLDVRATAVPDNEIDSSFTHFQPADAPPARPESHDLDTFNPEWAGGVNAPIDLAITLMPYLDGWTVEGTVGRMLSLGWSHTKPPVWLGGKGFGESPPFPLFFNQQRHNWRYFSIYEALPAWGKAHMVVLTVNWNTEDDLVLRSEVILILRVMLWRLEMYGRKERGPPPVLLVSMRASKIRVYQATFDADSNMLDLRYTRPFALGGRNYADLDEFLKIITCLPREVTAMDVSCEAKAQGPDQSVAATTIKPKKKTHRGKKSRGKRKTCATDNTVLEISGDGSFSLI